jgi:hypothetical protein
VRWPDQHSICAPGETGVNAFALAGRAVLVLLTALFGGASGLGALLGAAAVSDRPPLFLLADLAALSAAYSLGPLRLPLVVLGRRLRSTVGKGSSSR